MKTERKVMTCGVLVLILLCGCAAESQAPQQVSSVGMILGSGGVGDRSFNDSAYAGLEEAQSQFGTHFETVDYTSDEADLAALRGFIQEEYDLIIGIGFENASYIETLSQEHPDRMFAVVDVVVEGDNVASIVFREQEGDFLMGILAAMLTESKKVGFIGGMDIDVIRRIEGGFLQGVAYQDSSVEVVSDFAGTFADSEVGNSLALAQYESGVDVIYNAAGRTGLGIIEAAEETGNLTIGTSGDQRELAPGYVVGNRPKRVDTAVLLLIGEIEAGQFQPGTRSLGLAEEGLGLGPFDEDLVSGAMLERLEELRQQIITGEIEVIDVTSE